MKYNFFNVLLLTYFNVHIKKYERIYIYLPYDYINLY